MKKWVTMLIAFSLAFSITGCIKNNDKTVLDMIKASPAATMELPDGSSVSRDFMSTMEFILETIR